MNQTRTHLLAISANGSLSSRAASVLGKYDVVHSVDQLSDRLSFNVAKYLQLLRTRELGHLLLATARLPSTQDLVREAGSELPNGTVALADQQTQGKGRGGNSWVSPAGCLMFTAARTVSIPGTVAPYLNYVVCLAIVRAVQSLAGAAGKATPPGSPPLLRIKWPNDIYYNGLKVGGALLHSSWSGGSFRVTTGIGLNVTNREPTTCLADILAAAPAAAAAAGGLSVGAHTGTNLQTATSISGPEHRAAAAAPSLPGSTASSSSTTTTTTTTTSSRGGPPEAAMGAATGPQHSRTCDCEAGPPLGREEVLAEVLLQLEHCFDVLEQHGSFEPLKEEYLAAWLHTGQRLTLQDQPGQQEELEVVVEGLSPAGFLQARDAAGQRYELTPDGNSLDMMRGLVRRKLPA